MKHKKKLEKNNNNKQSEAREWMQQAGKEMKNKGKWERQGMSPFIAGQHTRFSPPSLPSSFAIVSWEIRGGGGREEEDGYEESAYVHAWARKEDKCNSW